MKFPTLSRNEDPALRRSASRSVTLASSKKLDRLVEVFITVMFLSITLLVCCSCGSTKVATQLVRDIKIDTVYLSNIQYDSIYIYKDRVSEHHLGTLPLIKSDGQYLEAPMRTDTLYVKDVSIEYRYKLLKDTIRVVERDSIPYQVTVTEIKEITRPLTWYDHLTRSVFWIVIGVLFLLLVKFVFNLNKRFTL